MRPLAVPLTGICLVALLASGCTSDTDRYCDEVKAQQKTLTDLSANPDPNTIFDVLEPYQALAAKAPDDIKAEWATVIDRYQQLQAALSDAGVSVDEYTGQKWRRGLSTEQVNGIVRAAAGLVDPATSEALNGVQQQARDVCQTPLSF